MKFKKIIINGEEKEIVTEIDKDEIENNNDIISTNVNLENTIDLTNTINTISGDVCDE